MFDYPCFDVGHKNDILILHTIVLKDTKQHAIIFPHCGNYSRDLIARKYKCTSNIFFFRAFLFMLQYKRIYNVLNFYYFPFMWRLLFIIIFFNTLVFIYNIQESVYCMKYRLWINPLERGVGEGGRAFTECS